jgi:GntR family transcriptional regulator / MocR family aminotransferase
MRRAEEKEIALGERPEGALRQRWLYVEIREAILSGRLDPGTRLPASRELARQYGISRGTILAAFDQLAAEGYLIAKVGGGTYVSARLPDVRNPRAQYLEPRAQTRGRLSARGQTIAHSPFPVNGATTPARAFRPNQPDLESFPVDLWNRIAARRSRQSRRAMFAAGAAGGFLPLRQAIADHLRYTMRIVCDARQVMIVGSVQQALDLCTRLLLDPGDEVWMEDPGYPGAQRIFASAGARLIGVPVDPLGIDVDAGIRRAPRARLAYVTPGHQTPLGMPLALERRLALLNWATAADAMVIEDDYDGEYRYAGSPLAALKSLDTAGRVIHAGTFSKILFPALRLAYVVLPDWLADHFAATMSVTCRHVTLLPQTVLHEFIAEGHLARHIRQMRMIYAERAETLQEAATTRLAGLLTVLPIATGLDATALLPEGSDDSRIAAVLAAVGIETRPLSAYCVDAPAPSGLVLGFAAFDKPQIDAGIAGIEKVLETAFRPAASSPDR